MSSETKTPEPRIETSTLGRSPAGYVVWRAPFGGAWHILQPAADGQAAAASLCALDVPPTVPSATRPLARVSAAVVCRWCRYQLALEHRRSAAAAADEKNVAGVRRPLADLFASTSTRTIGQSTAHSTGLAPDPPIVMRPDRRARAEHVASGDPCPAAPSAWAAGYREQGSEWSTGRRGSSELTSTKTPTRN